jgi:hypothetical protein
MAARAQTELTTTNSPQFAAGKTDPTQEFGAQIAEITYEAPAFADAGQFKAAFEKAEQGAHDAAKKKFSAEAEMILYIAQVQSYLSERGANAHLRRAAGIKAGFAEWYESFRAEYDIDYAFKSIQHKIAQLRGGCIHCGRLADIHNKSCVFYRKLIDRAEPGGGSKPKPTLDMKEASNAYLADRYLAMVGLLANAPKDASPQEIVATMQAEAVAAHQDLDAETAAKIRVPELALPKIAEQVADDPRIVELEKEVARVSAENVSLLQRLESLQTVPDNLRDETIMASLAAEPDRAAAGSILHDYLTTVVNRVLPAHIELDTLDHPNLRYAERDHRIMIGDWLRKQKPHTEDAPILAKCTAIGECGARRRVREWVDGAWAKEHVVYGGDEGNYRVITAEGARELAPAAFSVEPSKERL